MHEELYMKIKILGSIKTDNNIIYYKFPLVYDYEYAKQLPYEDVVYIREAIANNYLDDADGFSYCHQKMLNTVAMEHLVSSIK